MKYTSPVIGICTPGMLHKNNVIVSSPCSGGHVVGGGGHVVTGQEVDGSVVGHVGGGSVGGHIGHETSGGQVMGGGQEFPGIGKYRMQYVHYNYSDSPVYCIRLLYGPGPADVLART